MATKNAKHLKQAKKTMMVRAKKWLAPKIGLLLSESAMCVCPFCVRACMRACVRACVSECVCEVESAGRRKGGRGFIAARRHGARKVITATFLRQAQQFCSKFSDTGECAVARVVPRIVACIVARIVARAVARVVALAVARVVTRAVACAVARKIAREVACPFACAMCALWQVAITPRSP